jgi:hypothetical protein
MNGIFRRKARRSGGSVEISVPPEISNTKKFHLGDGKTVGIWINKNWNIEMTSVNNLINSGKFNGTVIFRTMYKRGGSLVLTVPAEVLNTINLIRRLEIKYFEILINPQDNIELYP